MFVNKSLLSGSAKLDAPLFVTWYQCVVTVLACYVIRQLARYFPGKVGWALGTVGQILLSDSSVHTIY